jgi:hypothetical protein
MVFGEEEDEFRFVDVLKVFDDLSGFFVVNVFLEDGFATGDNKRAIASNVVEVFAHLGTDLLTKVRVSSSNQKNASPIIAKAVDESTVLLGHHVRTLFWIEKGTVQIGRDELHGLHRHIL